MDATRSRGDVGTTLYDEMQAGRFPVLVSLPRNDLDLARAAVAGGAAGIKVHLNGHHRASGTIFGSFSEERAFLERLSELPVRKIVMVGQEAVPSAVEMAELHRLGFEGFNLYWSHARPHLFGNGLRPFLALAHDRTGDEMRALARHRDAVIEASIVSPGRYGEALGPDDLDGYAEIVEATGLPVVVPSQKRIVANDLPRLRERGVQALLIGAIVTGSSPATVEAATRTMVEAASRLQGPASP